MQKELLISMMEKMGAAITGIPISVIEEKNIQKLASSCLRNEVGYIKIAFDMVLPGLTDEEKEIIMFGLYAHELLHILLTDFEFVSSELYRYPDYERNVRFYINNLIEDPAIEFFGDQYLSDFLLSSLKDAINYFYKDSKELQDYAPTGFIQLINAMVQYGDVGIIKGHFTFPEARDAFIKIVPIMSEAIEEPDPKIRFYKSQEIFDIVEPLWKDHEKNLYSQSLLDDVLKQYGKNLNDQSGSAMQRPDPDEEHENPVSDRRKKTLHLITKKQAEQLENELDKAATPEDATDIFIVIDEEDESEEKAQENSPSISDNCLPTKEEPESTPSEPESENESETDANPESFEEMLGAEIEKLGEELAKEMNLDIEEDLVSVLNEMLEAALESMIRDEQLSKMQKKQDSLAVEVSSTYYKRTPQYIVSEVSEGDEKQYKKISTDMKTYILHLKSELNRIFQLPYAKTEYRTSGRLDVKRACGRKISARLFKKRHVPDDKADLAIIIVLDASGSMENKSMMVKKCGVLLTESFAKSHVSIKVMDFATLSGSNADTTYRHYGSWKNTYDDRIKITAYKADGGTFLGHAIRYAGNLLKRRCEQHKLMIIITDGDPYSDLYKDYNSGMNDCRSAVSSIRKYADVIGIGIYNSEEYKNNFEFIFQDAFVSFQDISTLTKELPKKIKKIIKNY